MRPPPSPENPHHSK